MMDSSQSSLCMKLYYLRAVIIAETQFFPQESTSYSSFGEQSFFVSVKIFADTQRVLLFPFLRRSDQTANWFWEIACLTVGCVTSKKADKFQVPLRASFPQLLVFSFYRRCAEIFYPHFIQNTGTICVLYGVKMCIIICLTPVRTHKHTAVCM